MESAGVSTGAVEVSVSPVDSGWGEMCPHALPADLDMVLVADEEKVATGLS